MQAQSCLRFSGVYSLRWFTIGSVLWAMLYVVVLAVSTSIAVIIRGSYGQNIEDIRVFFMLIRKNDLKHYLLEKRRDIEVNLAQLVRMAKQLSNK